MSTQKRQSRGAAIIGVIFSTGFVLAGATASQPAVARVVPAARADHCHGPPSKAWCHDRADARTIRARDAERRIACGPPSKRLHCSLPTKPSASSTPGGEQRGRRWVYYGPPGKSPPFRYRR